ncbi:hypothetical protein CR66_07070 [Campylobacter mucosalis]|uniref:hypothetical protein n=1 Tax=Campylobacter mucosalis TaxID=202 RepID=UPI0004D9463E|nr:hypothetical protein [Campylobacter mucosalis]KEA45583.1 hypothetical protein CR66_07070 [Campylobacter mucosalis]QKF63282.1 hypothetical protein CMCT_1158 [Campylobacter mucosalis]
MGKNTLLAVVLLLLILVGISGVYLYKFANSDTASLSNDTTTTYQSKENLTKEQQTSWVKDLAGLGKKEYVLPVNEIFIHYKRKNKEPQKTAYQLFIDKNDVYSMFCLTQTLKDSNVDFTIIKDGVKSQIFLNTQDSELLQKIILKLRKYDIDTSVTEVKI